MLDEFAVDKHEPSADELTESIIAAGVDWNYRIERDETGKLSITSIGGRPPVSQLRFGFTETELVDYYRRLAALTESPFGQGTGWATWMLLMSTHLSEAVYQAGVLGRPCVIVIDESGFTARAADAE